MGTWAHVQVDTLLSQLETKFDDMSEQLLCVCEAIVM